jgi:lycopene cyclase domain-containing protein
MTTYLLLNIVFFISLVMFMPKKFSKPGHAWLYTLIGIFILTAIFDPLLVSFHIIGYTASKILGVKWFGAPIEDFFYALYAACIIPLVWNKLGEKNETSHK